MTGKEKCSILREIRYRIAAENGVEWDEEECTHTGPCKGTCPVCERRTRRLTKALTGKKIMFAATLAAGLCPVSGCNLMEDPTQPEIIELTGEADDSGSIEKANEPDEEEELTGDVAFEGIPDSSTEE